MRHSKKVAATVASVIGIGIGGVVTTLSVANSPVDEAAKVTFKVTGLTPTGPNAYALLAKQGGAGAASRSSAGEENRQEALRSNGVTVQLAHLPERKETCITADNPEYAATNCAPDTHAQSVPPTLTLNHPATGNSEVYGAAPDGVDSAEVIDAGGKPRRVKVTNNVFVVQSRGMPQDVRYYHQDGSVSSADANAAAIDAETP